MITEAEVLAALPSHGFVRAYVEYASQCTDANAAYHLGGALTCLTQTTPLDFCVPYASPLWSNLYTLVVGDSSKSRKTAAINICQRVLREAVPGSVGEVPGSQEGLYEGLRHQQRQLIVYGEFGEFLAKSEQGYLMPMKTALTNLWDGVPIGRALANKRAGAVENPRLSLLCGVATDLLERHTEQADWTGGFLARFLTLYAEPEREFASPPIDDAARRQGVVSWLASIASPPAPPGPCRWLDASAKQMWDDWWADLRHLRDGANRRAAAACSRTTSIAAKTALLLSWDIGQARSGQPWHVTVNELEPALKIANLHLGSVIELGERVAGSKDMRDRATVLRNISVEVPTPFGYILSQSAMLKRRAQEVIDSLMEERMIERVQVNKEICYRKTPHAHQLLVQMAQGIPAETGFASPPPSMGQVIQLRPPPAPVAVAQPAEDLDDAEYWARFSEDED
jgi:hypothetical protein